MPRRTNPFQSLSASIMAVFYGSEYEVVESVLTRNSKTGAVRELDIRIVRHADPADRTLVECRAHKRRQDVRWIDELEGKARRLGFPRVIAISSSGFTRTAAREGAERGVETLHLKEAEERDWRTWKFGLQSFGVNFVSQPHVSSVSFGVAPQFIERIPTPIDLADVILVDRTKKVRCTFKEWIEGFEKDPRLVEQLNARSTNGRVNHFEYRVPCDPAIGVVFPPHTTILPLAEVSFGIDYLYADYNVRMRPLTIGEKRALVGESILLGKPTRVVVHELPGKLKVMLESRVKIQKPRD